MLYCDWLHPPVTPLAHHRSWAIGEVRGKSTCSGLTIALDQTLDWITASPSLQMRPPQGQFAVCYSIAISPCLHYDKLLGNNLIKESGRAHQNSKTKKTKTAAHQIHWRQVINIKKIINGTTRQSGLITTLFLLSFWQRFCQGTSIML